MTDRCVTMIEEMRRSQAAELARRAAAMPDSGEKEWHAHSVRWKSIPRCPRWFILHCEGCGWRVGPIHQSEMGFHVNEEMSGRK